MSNRSLVFKIDQMLGAEAARVLNKDYVGPTVHRRGTNCRGMFLDSHMRIQERVIIDGNMCPVYLQSLGQELSSLDREIFDEFYSKVRGEVDTLAIQGRAFGSCPMLLTSQNCPVVFRQIRETTMHAVIRNFMCKFGIL